MKPGHSKRECAASGMVDQFIRLLGTLYPIIRVTYNLRQSSMPAPRRNIVLPRVNAACVTPGTEEMLENEGKTPDTGQTP
jgi:hypothetical protein